jgi:hypothetical protein
MNSEIIFLSKSYNVSNIFFNGLLKKLNLSMDCWRDKKIGRQTFPIKIWNRGRIAKG